MNKKDLIVIKDYARANEGLTLNANGKVLSLQDGFMVAIKEHERVYQDIQELDIETLNAYMLMCKKLNKEGKKCFVGFWIDSSDNNKFYLDISLKVSNKQLALSLGKREKQLSIFDNARKDCVAIEY